MTLDKKKIFSKRNCIILGLILTQILTLTIIGIVTKDKYYEILISIAGILFNMLVCLNISYGFIFGIIYAITNGVLAYYTKIYATFGFMIIMQAPMAMYSFVAWHKNKNSQGTIMKTLKKWQIALVFAGMIIGSVASYYLLQALNSRNLIPDTIFFVCSVACCILLALRARIAYVLAFLAGVGGTLLYTTQAINLGTGISIAVFNGMTAINGIIALIKNYSKKKVPTTINQSGNKAEDTANLTA